MTDDSNFDPNKRIKKLISECNRLKGDKDVWPTLDTVPICSAHFNERRAQLNEMYLRRADQWCLNWAQSAINLLENKDLEALTHPQRNPPAIIRHPSDHGGESPILTAKRHAELRSLDMQLAKGAATTALRRWKNMPKDILGQNMFDRAVAEIRALQDDSTSHSTFSVLADRLSELKTRCQDLVPILEKQCNDIQSSSGIRGM